MVGILSTPYQCRYRIGGRHRRFLLWLVGWFCVVAVWGEFGGNSDGGGSEREAGRRTSTLIKPYEIPTYPKIICEDYPRVGGL